MFHDQGLPVIKYAGFGSAVNVTLGLPIVRTSVDHGTALDLAGTGRAEPAASYPRYSWRSTWPPLHRPPTADRQPLPSPHVRARKRFGQHFLHDPGVIGRIVAAIDPQPGERMVEIGPGLGAMTLPLLARAAGSCTQSRSIATPSASARSQRRERPRLHLHEADVLEFDFAAARRRRRGLRVVGNLPYNISTPLLFHLLEQREHIRDMHFMLQKEVVDRMAAQPVGTLRAPDGDARAVAAHRAAVRRRARRVPPAAACRLGGRAPRAARPSRCRSSSRAAIATVVAAAFRSGARRCATRSRQS